MILYIIIALAFAIMYSIKYAHKVVDITEQTVQVLDVTWGSFNPVVYHIREFLYNFIMFPYAITRIFKANLIKDEVQYILENNYGLTAEK